MLTVSIELQSLKELVRLLANRCDLDGVSLLGFQLLILSVDVDHLIDRVGEDLDQVRRLQGVEFVSARAVLGDELFVAPAFLACIDGGRLCSRT